MRVLTSNDIIIAKVMLYITDDIYVRIIMTVAIGDTDAGNEPEEHN